MNTAINNSPSRSAMLPPQRAAFSRPRLGIYAHCQSSSSPRGTPSRHRSRQLLSRAVKTAQR